MEVMNPDGGPRLVAEMSLARDLAGRLRALATDHGFRTRAGPSGGAVAAAAPVAGEEPLRPQSDPARSAPNRSLTKAGAPKPPGRAWPAACSGSLTGQESGCPARC